MLRKSSQFPAYYTDFHLNALWEIAQENSVSIMLMHPTREIMPDDYLRWDCYQNARAIKTQRELHDLFCQGSTLGGASFRSFIPKYLQRIAQASQQVKSFFFENDIFGSIYLKEMNPLLAQCTHDEAYKILSQNPELARVDNTFEQTIIALKRFPDHVELVQTYFHKPHSFPYNEVEVNFLRDAIIRQYAEDLQLFAGIPIIKDYLRAQEKEIFTHDKQEKVFHLCIEVNALRNKFPFSNMVTHEYKEFLDKFMAAVAEKKDDLGVNHLFSTYQDKNFHVYFHMCHEDIINQPTAQKMIESFFSYAQDNQLKNNDSLIPGAIKWIDKFLLEQALPIHEFNTRKKKI